MSASLEHAGLPAQGARSSFYRKPRSLGAFCGSWRLSRRPLQVHQREGRAPGSCALNSANPGGCSRAHRTFGLSNPLHGSRGSQLSGPFLFTVDLQTRCGAIKYVFHTLSYGRAPTLRSLSSSVGSKLLQERKTRLTPTRASLLEGDLTGVTVTTFCLPRS